MRINFQLLHAIRHGSYDDVKTLLDQGANPSASGSDELSGLSLCDQCARIDVARLLIQRGANLNELIGPNGDTLLHRAIIHGNLHFAKLLLESGIHPDVKNKKGNTPLHLAAERDLQYFTRTLFAHGAFPFVVNNTGNTPLHIAARHGRIDLMRTLLNAGSDASFINNKGLSPLDEAVASGHPAAVSVLLERCKQTYNATPELVAKARKKAARSGDQSILEAFNQTTGRFGAAELSSRTNIINQHQDQIAAEVWR